MKSSSDQDILERARRFEAQALEEIFDFYSPGIYRYAFRLLGDSELAKECMAETFSRFLSILRQERGPNNYLQAYLYRIAHNWITDYYRSKVPPSLPLLKDIPTDTRDEPNQVVIEELDREQLRKALSLLTPDQRQVIVLRYLEDFENEMIAQALNKPIGAIKALQHRALASLRRILASNEDIKQ